MERRRVFMPVAARIGDTHVCPSGVPGKLLPKPTKVTIGKQLAATVDTPATPCAGGPNKVIIGSRKVTIGGLAAARIGDKTAHGSVITTGYSKVTIGG
jgi:uncharacterized Zn-binding protein involved in type VI secretion